MSEEEIFYQALTRRDPEERAAYLDQACGGDAALRASIEALLQANIGATGFMERTARDPDATVDSPGGEPPGAAIGSYKLLQQIGEGGFGVVYRAEQQRPIRRKVALKILKPGMDTRQVVARFEAERQALALMDHPNIARVLDGGETASGRPYFVMELVEGIPITDFCDGDHLTVRQRLEIFVAVCQAVQHAHQKGIIHRDLKPSNILVARQDDRPVVKVIDFGVAKAMGQKLTERTLFTNAAQIVGTPLYMSPEQADPTALDIDTRADIYALGALLYEFLTGTTPFDRERLGTLPLDEVRRIIREEEPVRPSARMSTRRRKGEDGRMKDASTPRTRSAWQRLLPFSSFILHPSFFQELDWIVMKCLDKDRARRYETANGLARDVQRYLNDEPVEACPPSPAYRFQKFVRTHRKPIGVAAALALILAAATIVSTRQAIRATHAERAAGLERDKAIAERERADEQVAIARAVNDFLQKDLLGQADIANQAAGQERNKNITVREVLDRAALGIEARFRGQKQTEAAVRLTLGTAYRALGEYPEAQKHLDRSRQLRQQKLGPEHPETLESLQALAGLNTDRGQYSEAERLYQHVLGSRRANLGPDHRDTLQTLNDLGDAYNYGGRYEEAEQLLKQALERRRARLGADHLDTLQTMLSLASLYCRRSEYDVAGRFGKQAVDGFRAKLGADHPDALRATSMLALIYTERARFDEAERLCTDVVEAYRAKLGPDHPDSLDATQNLADLHYHRQRYDQALALQKPVLQARRARLGADHPATLRSLNSLALCYYELGRFDEAEPLLMQVIDINRRTLGADHPEAITTLHNLGIVYRDRGRYDEAEPLLREALAGAEKRLGLGHELTQTIILNVADLHGRQGRPHLTEPILRRVVKFLREHPVSDPLVYAVQLGELAGNLLAQKKYAEAEPMARECLAIRSEKRPDRWVTFYARTTVGGALLGQGKYAEAEPLLIQAFEGMKARESQMRPSSKFLMLEPLERLVQLYDAWGKAAEAARWRKVLEGEKSRQK
jgi:non-specific serine/threonine protein kinase/serine/threonine-protein kinase